jgi:hypothetical protein
MYDTIVHETVKEKDYRYRRTESADLQPLTSAVHSVVNLIVARRGEG